MPGSFAAAIGLAPGDVILSIGGIALEDAAAMRRALRLGASDDEVRVEVIRGGVARRLAGRAVRVEPESVAGGTVRYGALVRGDVALRTIATIPNRDTAATAPPLLVFFQGISCSSLDFGGGPLPPLGQVFHELTRRGIATLRLERRGLGDSEGGPCEAVDFATEVDDLVALTDAATLAELPIDRARVVFLGHSIGGMTLPIVARSNPPWRAIAVGTSAVRWSECMAASTRRQMLLHGASEAEAVGAAEEEARALATALPSDIRFGRSGAFHRQLQNAHIEAAYAALACPLLVVQGEHDWVVGEEESRALASRPGAALFVVPGMDHAFTHHASLADSLAAFGKGNYEPALVDRIEAFVRGD